MSGKIIYFKTGRPMYMTNISIYSVAKPEMADGMARAIANYMNNPDSRVLDATANVGGISVYLAKYFKRLTSLEFDKVTYELLKQNLPEHVKVIHGDALKEIQKPKYDVIFFDPPWGGTNDILQLSLGGKSIRNIINTIPKNVVVAVLIPPKFDFTSLCKLKYIMPYVSKKNRLLIFDRR